MNRARKSKLGIAQSSKQPSRPADRLRATPRSLIVVPAFLSALLLWASFAPVNASFLAWLAPVGWLSVIERERAPDRRGYFLLYLSGWLFWMMNLQGIRLAFWALIFGWIAISIYLAIYIPLFIGITRTMRVHWRWPLIVAAPVAWVGLKVARSFIITGYAASQLGHTQAHLPLVIQIADQFGGYGVSYLIMSISVAIWQAWAGFRNRALRPVLLPVAVALLLLLGSIGYGWWRLGQADAIAASTKPLLKVMLLQENTPTIFDSDEQRVLSAWGRYLDLTREAARQFGIVDLVVWPESTFTASVPWTQIHITSGIPAALKQLPDISEQALQHFSERSAAEFEIKVKRVLAAARNESMISPPAEPERDLPYLLLGCDAWLIDSTKSERFNSAILVSPAGAYQDRYDKMHLVMFGEYIPLGPVLQFLSDAFGLGSVEAGKSIKSFDVAGAKVAPNICFESMLPELISWQMRRLVAENRAPDVLINLTNDSWFWGSSILDHHLACSIFCAVENRRPLLVAANTGLSAEIDGSGRLLQVSKRMAKGTLLAEPRADGRGGLVQRSGYPPAWLCCCLTSLALLAAIFRRWRESRRLAR